MSDPARTRYFLIVAARLVGTAGAVLGVILLARAQTWPPKLLGVAIVLAALVFSASVPAHLARRWRTPPQP